MSKAKLLIEKYGLPEDLADEIVRDFKHAELFDQSDDEIRPTSTPDKNKAIIQKLFDAEPDWHKPAAMNKTYGIKYQLTQIDFVVNGETLRLDDLVLIEQIRKLIATADFKYTPKYRKKTNRVLINHIAQKLIDHLNEPTIYKKRVVAGRIIGEFRKDFSPDLSNEKIVEKMKNLSKD